TSILKHQQHNYYCTLRQVNSESVLHCLARCPFAEEVWHLSDLQASTNADGFSDFWKWWSKVMENLKSQPHWRRGQAWQRRFFGDYGVNGTSVSSSK
ncbi:hypothetical protein PIB30_047133, partial [Stylosanthes scabra]|nr:hypothetical protein [Stylosanthes scabra]